MDTSNEILLPVQSVPDAGAVLNPFVIVDDAASLITFISEVFGVPETTEARTPLPDGKLIHAELQLGTVNLMLADRFDGWPARPGLLQVWVRDVATVLERATAQGATTITEPIPFYGEVVGTRAGPARPDTRLGRRFGRDVPHARRGSTVPGEVNRA